VIALTALSGKRDREGCIEAGMDDFLPKPVRRVELDAAIERVITGQSAPLPSSAPVEFGESPIDKSTLLAACDGNEALLKEMIIVFQAEAPQQLAAIEVAIQREDSTQLREAAHKLKGLVSTFSFAAAAVFESLEQLGSDDHCTSAADQFSVAAQRVRELLSFLPSLTLEQLQN
jgi:two-component system sensor histidine kinase/response regulator